MLRAECLCLPQILVLRAGPPAWLEALQEVVMVVTGPWGLCPDETKGTLKSSLWPP